MSRVAQSQQSRPERSGRWSPPLWGCYEYQTECSDHDSECDTCADSDEESDTQEQRQSESGTGTDSDSDERARTDKRNGKKPEPVRRKREPVYRPILTIRRSEGFVWNQDLFLPSYIRDRYVATSPNSSYTGNTSTSTCDSSFSGMDFEIECVDIHVDGTGILDNPTSPTKDE